MIIYIDRDHSDFLGKLKTVFSSSQEFEASLILQLRKLFVLEILSLNEVPVTELEKTLIGLDGKIEDIIRTKIEDINEIIT
jgi:hypothetical protein